ncbi:MAG: TonB-dependent receptor [Myxococcales bacterium FL481]|nr:MAG: TonB-dependent receptor [Myxococcales bacterium FL481]
MIELARRSSKSSHLAVRWAIGAALLCGLPPATAEASIYGWQPPPADDTTGPPAPDGFVQPQLLNEVELTYPADLAERPDAPQGRVVVRYVVGVDGVPKELEVAEGVDPRLDALAVEAVGKLRYRAATYQGQPVEVTLAIGLDIVVPAPAPPPPPATSADENAEVVYETDDEDGPDAEAGPVRISGKLLTAGDRTPVEGGSVVAVPAGDLPVGRIKKKIYEELEPAWSIEAITQDDGSFELRGLPDGRCRLIFMTQGYERLEYVVELARNEALEVKYFQTPLSTNPYRTVVRMDRDQPVEVVRRKISAQEIGNLPGTQGDALKSIQNFPGVARAPFGAGLLLIRGSAPDDSATYLAGHEIPQLFHFGGITSVFNSDILTEIDFIPGNFDSRYGDAIGGVINVAPRKGRRDGYHGYVDSDIFDTGVLVEGPIGKGSFILSGRRSYIDLLLPALIPPDVQDALSFSVAPRYWDYQALFDYPLAGGELTIRGFGSDDRLSLLFRGEDEEEVDARNEVSTVITFHRADIAYEKREGPWRFFISPTYRRDFSTLNAIDLVTFDLTADTLALRAELERRITQNARWSIGTEFQALWFDFTITAPPVPEGEGGGAGATTEQLTRSAEVSILIPAVYSTLTWAPTQRLTLFPGVRVTQYTAPISRASLDPRLRLNYQITEQTALKGGIGLYTQAPAPNELDPTFGNPGLGLERAAHYSVGAAHDFPRDISLEVTGFYKNLWDMVAPSERASIDASAGVKPELYANTGIGRIYGAEALLRKNLTSNVFGWVSYTLMRSETRSTPGDDWRLFDFDQTHILTILGVYKFPHDWQFGARFRLVSGNPTTPINNGILNANDGGFIPLQGPINSDRLPMFHQLDLRIDKKWVRKRITINAYLDVQNVYNRQNTEFANYSFNYQEVSYGSALPIVPSLGLKVEF